MNHKQSHKKKSQTFLLAFVLFLGSFFLLEYKNISLVLANITHDITWYQGDSSSIKNYNESMYLVEAGELEKAKSLLSPLLNQPDVLNPGSVFELYGDIVYALEGASGDVLPFYKRSLEYEENFRVERKIAFIENQLQVDKKEKDHQDAGTGGTVSSSGFSSGSFERDAKKQEIQAIQQNRGGVVNFSSPLPGEKEEKIQGILHMLGGGDERKDW